jgi:hypothetical protein
VCVCACVCVCLCVRVLLCAPVQLDILAVDGGQSYFLSSIYLNSIRTLKFKLNSRLPSPDGVNEMKIHGHFDVLFVRISEEFFFCLVFGDWSSKNSGSINLNHEGNHYTFRAALSF